MLTPNNCIVISTSLLDRPIPQKRVANLKMSVAPLNTDVKLFPIEKVKPIYQISQDNEKDRMKRFIDSKYEYGILCDDDFFARGKFLEELNKTVALLPGNWRTLHLCPCHLWGKGGPKATPLVLQAKYKRKPHAHSSGRYFNLINTKVCRSKIGIGWLGTPVAFLINKKSIHEYLSLFETMTQQYPRCNDDIILTHMINDRDFVCRDPLLGYENEAGGSTFFANTTTTTTVSVPIVTKDNCAIFAVSVKGNQIAARRCINLKNSGQENGLEVIIKEVDQAVIKNTNERCRVCQEKYRRIAKLFMDSEYKYGILCDDDFVTCPSFLKELNYTVSQLPPHWQSLHLCPGPLWDRKLPAHFKDKRVYKKNLKVHSSGRFFLDLDGEAVARKSGIWLGRPVAVLVNKMTIKKHMDKYENCVRKRPGLADDFILSYMCTNSDFICRDPLLGHEDQAGGTTFQQSS